MPTDAIEDVDVAIVGGGPAGCFLAWRLASADLAGSPLAALAARRPDGRLKILLAEREDRVGGRIETLRVPELPDVPVEMGAIAIVAPPDPNEGPHLYNGHHRIASLVNALAREPTTRASLRVSAIPGAEPNTPFYMRGKHF